MVLLHLLWKKERQKTPVLLSEPAEAQGQSQQRLAADTEQHSREQRSLSDTPTHGRGSISSLTLNGP